MQPHRALSIALPGLCIAASLTAQMPSARSMPAAGPDTLFFRDGDKLSGELIRVENGQLIFRSPKTGDESIAVDHVQDLLCPRLFAVLRNGDKINRQNAVVGRLEVKDEALIISPAAGSPITLRANDVAYAIEDGQFEREINRKYGIHEGWSLQAGAGATLVRSTETSNAFNSDLALSRTLPGIDYLSRRDSTRIALRDTYETINRPDGNGGLDRTEVHIFHAEAERNQFLHKRFYLIGNYTFDRNYAQGLLAGQLLGVGLGYTVVKNGRQTLDLKSDLTRATQGFVDPGQNDTLLGQKFIVEYRRSLPLGIDLEETGNYLPSYNLPHDYSANSLTVLRVPLLWRIGLAFTIEDNYLNNHSPGTRPNTFRANSSLTYSR